MKSLLQISSKQTSFVTVAFLSLLLVVMGCQTPANNNASPDAEAVGQEVSNISESLILREGDMVKVTFPGAPNLDTAQQIRRDGKITLQLIGEMSAAGMTPTQLEKEIIRLCGSQLVSKEVLVTVDASLFPVFVTGAVVNPGKIMTDRPITALQAIMQAGGFNYTTANLKSVRVIREENGRVKNFHINLKETLQGKNSDPFNLKPADIVYVPAKFSWF